MPWFVRLAVVMVVIPSVVLAMDHLRRRGLPRLPKLRLPSFGRGSRAVPERFALQVAKTVADGGFEKVHFVKKPHVDSFPRQYACPHCGGGSAYPWDLSRAKRLLGDKETPGRYVELARQISQKKFCLRCLEQLSDFAAGEKEHLKELDKKDPRILPRRVGRIRVPSLLQLGALTFVAAFPSSSFFHEVRVAGVMRLEVALLFASFTLLILAGVLQLLKVVSGRAR